MRDRIRTAQRIIETASLGDIQLTEASFGRHIRNPDEVSDEFQLEIATSYLAEVAERQGDSLFILASLLLEITPTRENAVDDDSAPLQDEGEDSLPHSDDAIAWVRSVYELHYRLPDDLEANDEELSAFAETNATFNAWPYFREFVQSSMARMGLPPVFLPLFRVPRRGDPGEDAVQNHEDST